MTRLENMVGFAEHSDKPILSFILNEREIDRERLIHTAQQAFNNIY